MLKKEVIWREILIQARLIKKIKFTQKELAQKFNFSLSTIFNALKTPRQNHCIRVEGRFFILEDYKKLLYLWANERSLKKEIIYQGRSEKNILELESEIPNETTFGFYSAYKFLYQDAPADYDHLYLYSDIKDLDKLIQRLSLVSKPHSSNNVFILKKDPWMKFYKESIVVEQVFVDIWNSGEWYAKDFLKSLGRNLIYKLW